MQKKKPKTNVKERDLPFWEDMAVWDSDLRTSRRLSGKLISSM